MPRTNHSTKTTRGSAKANSTEVILSTAPPPDDSGLADVRRLLFLADDTRPTVPFQPNAAPAEQDVELAARQRMAAKLLAFDLAFDQPTTSPS